MNYQDIFTLAKELSREEQVQLVVSLTHLHSVDSHPELLQSRCKALINKQEKCPHCAGNRYYRYGRAKGAQRFKCWDCGRTFCEYTGTWLEGLHKKSLVEPYLEMMIAHYSSDKTSKELKINKKTALDRRHKILSSPEQNTGEEFEGIVESDETFFEHSEKGNTCLNRPARNRGTQAKNKGIEGQTKQPLSYQKTATKV
jgi:transposase-like protein